MQKQFDVIVFDLGGVLVKYRERPKILDWVHDRLTLEELWRRWLGSDLVRDYETGKISSAAFAAGIIEEYRLPVGPEQYLASFAASHEAVYEGAEELLRQLSANYVLAALSNTNETLWERCRVLGILSFFHHLFPSHKIGFVKPDPRLYEHMLHTLAVPSARVLFFDDHQENVAAAQERGIRAYRVLGLPDMMRKLKELAII
jgi:putative hydrolase of the HAD superfamily